MPKIHKLREPIKEPFWSVWQQYGWKKDTEHNGAGVSLDVQHFIRIGSVYVNDEDFVAFYIEKKGWFGISKENARILYQEYNSVRTSEKGKKLVVLPLSQMLEWAEEPADHYETI